MNRYNGSTGRVEYVPDPAPDILDPPPFFVEDTRGEPRKPSGQSGILGGLGGLISKFGRPNLGTEDLMLCAIFYLLYRESKDIEFLLIAGALLFM